MLRKLLIISIVCLSTVINAAQILWIGIDDSATIGDSGQTVRSWVNSLSDPDLASFRIRIGDTILEDAWGIGSTVGWIVLDDGGGWCNPKTYEVRLPDDITNDSVISYDIGLVDYNDIWVTTVGTASETFANLDGPHVYDQGTIEEPREGDWMPNHYIPVPEPSTAILLIFGVCSMLLRRKHD